jgi:zinc protease
VKKFILSSLLILSTFVSLSLAQSQKAPQTPFRPGAIVKPNTPQQALEIPFVTKTLSNGLEVIVLQDSSVPIVTVEIAVRNGSFTEPPELNGLSHLYEHMFFKTNRAIALFRCDLFTKYRRSDLFTSNGCDSQQSFKSQIGDVSYLGDVDQLGYLRNGSTQEEYVNYYFNTTSGNLPTIMRLMRDAMLYPSFDQKDFSEEIISTAP